MTSTYPTMPAFMTASGIMVCMMFIMISFDAHKCIGLDDLISKHISHLFIRDPLVIFSETINQDDSTSTEHFEVHLFDKRAKLHPSNASLTFFSWQNIQSTNWQSLRFKPPPPNSTIGWRVEFRTMEVQMTDFENAAFAVFVALLSRAILKFNLNFYLPISKVNLTSSGQFKHFISK